MLTIDLCMVFTRFSLILPPQSVIHWTHDGTLPISMVYANRPRRHIAGERESDGRSFVHPTHRRPIGTQRRPANAEFTDLRTMSENAPNSIS